MMSNEPSGASYKNFIHYSQLIDYSTETFKRWDYESEKDNLEHYGQITPPDYDLSLIDFPIAMFAGEKDLVADPKDVEWTYQQLKKHTVFYHQYYLGHMSFAIAKDMSWFDVDAMAILNHYNGKCSESTTDSKFEHGNERCRKELQESKSDDVKFMQE